jgi:hypothetical protein
MWNTIENADLLHINKIKFLGVGCEPQSRKYYTVHYREYILWALADLI